MKLVTIEEMRIIEREADAGGVSYAQMMENAGRNLAGEVMRLAYAQVEEAIQVVGLVGPGNNGGDTLVALAHLAEQGWKTHAYLVSRKSGKDGLAKRLKEAGGEIVWAEEDEHFQQLRQLLESADVLLDGVLGTGFRLPLKEEIGNVLGAVQGMVARMEWPPLIVAVDCPSGVDCDSGAAAEQVIPADATVTMAAIKRGLLALPAHTLVGELCVVEIGRLDDLGSWKGLKDDVVGQEQVAALLPRRPADAHKGTFGTALVAAGSLNYTGAALLSGQAAARSGAGLVTLAVPVPLHTALAGHFPEATWLLLPHEMGAIASPAAEILLNNIDRATALLIGPGLGLDGTTLEFIRKLLEQKPAGRTGRGHLGFLPEQGKDGSQIGKKLPPMVFDADGLRLLAKIEGWQKILPAPAILTPHPGEMSSLCGLAVSEIQADRLAIARKFAHEWGHVLVLKGAFTIVASPDGHTTTVPVATSTLAHAGTGDVLAGLIVGLLAQGMPAYNAAVAGAWIHARAGVAAGDLLGSSAAVLARDVLDCIPDILHELGE